MKEFNYTKPNKQKYELLIFQIMNETNCSFSKLILCQEYFNFKSSYLLEKWHENHDDEYYSHFVQIKHGLYGR